MSNGMRDMSHTPLTDKEISEVKEAIRRIGADESLFVFNDEKHLSRSTCIMYSKIKFMLHEIYSLI